MHIYIYIWEEGFSQLLYTFNWLKYRLRSWVMACKIHDTKRTDKKAQQTTKAMDEESKENK